tara:strand:+ start:1863 stop:1973 length:111 start_codon:yes stop_codon:yes gene_type:complete
MAGMANLSSASMNYPLRVYEGTKNNTFAREELKPKG